ncbi:glycoside hydrolase family 76 protein [Actinokineospora iranica]|uniref:Predicted alpha-1,6-mannanase, GH76 family n=1 Tax=Actinokineospora iranica TaxID=1271860 RepID=A0A1G6Q474_9PSEU|nr:glycoside hydrolase family 76 protein [Actinokineospora iranica]SDC87262.1 Predicted alpha-1,6-mannanase, GH76 family [Actinokineospora iranica]
MTRGAEQALPLWGARAGVAELATHARHLRRVWALPATRLGMARWPASPGDHLHLRWNYWWQAHLLDCLVDAQDRAPTGVRMGQILALVRGIRVRNFGVWTNDYYDDIAWLGLALLRAARAVPLDVARPLAEITAQLRAGWTDHGGGGIWWRRGDTFKNVPANGPAAILLARAHLDRADRQRARSMTEWMERYLVDHETGLLWDGLYVRPDGAIREVVTIVYTYCQGVYLGACVELAEDDPGGVWAHRAARTIRAVDNYLAVDGVLPGQEGGDGGLFAGILARYLAQSALRLPHAEGDLARRLVLTSADAAWHNRGVARSGPVFGPEWSRQAVTPRGMRDQRPERDLSVQLSGWMVLEAAALLERASITE